MHPAMVLLAVYLYLIILPLHALQSLLSDSSYILIQSQIYAGTGYLSAISTIVNYTVPITCTADGRIALYYNGTGPEVYFSLPSQSSPPNFHSSLRSFELSLPDPTSSTTKPQISRLSTSTSASKMGPTQLSPTLPLPPTSIACTSMEM
jgi:hypothetical protein